MSIDEALHRAHCFQIDSLNYKVGDCLFDTMHVLLHCRYTANQLRNGLVDHFLHRLHNGCTTAKSSFELDLHPTMLKDLHNIHDKNTYLHRMRLSATEINGNGETGLWGDTFCLKWLALWLNIPICIWSTTHKVMYLHFNKDACNPTISILFHDTNARVGHYEPVFSRLNTYNFIQTIQTHLPITHCNFNDIWNTIANAFDKLGLCRPTQFATTCDENMFAAIAFLLDVQLDAIDLRLFMAQSLANALIVQNKYALACFSTPEQSTITSKNHLLQLGVPVMDWRNCFLSFFPKYRL